MKLVSKHMVRHNCKITSALIESRLFIAFEKYLVLPFVKIAGLNL